MRVLDSLSGRELFEFPSGDSHRYGAVWTPDSSAILVSEMSAFVADDMGCRLQEGGSYRLSMVDIGSGEIEPMAWEDWFRSYPPTAPDEFVPACSGGGALTVEGLRETWCPEDEQLQWSLHGVLLTGADPYGLLGMFDPESAR
jgi:hypothetical protein